ncbi:MAG TPA: DUF5654 family protein [Patescibacteria group bacterium]|nr:DUF5654 family protein [Patescibacteria group bacterium]
MQTVKKQAKGFPVAVITQMITLSTSGFGFVAALSWNNVIQEFVNTYVKKLLPTGSGIISLLLYAILVTFLAVFITYQLTYIKERVIGGDEAS